MDKRVVVKLALGQSEIIEDTLITANFENTGNIFIEKIEKRIFLKSSRKGDGVSFKPLKFPKHWIK